MLKLVENSKGTLRASYLFHFWTSMDTFGRCLLLLLRIRSAHLEVLGFPIGMLTNTGVFLRGLKLCRESRS